MQYKCNGTNRENRVKGPSNHSTKTIRKQHKRANVKIKRKKNTKSYKKGELN